MRAGSLRTRIAIERDVGTETGPVGGRISRWETLLELPARVAHQNGREFEAASQISADLTVLLVVRFDARLVREELQGMRVRFRDRVDRVADILFAHDPTERRREIHIHATETH